MSSAFHPLTIAGIDRTTDDALVLTLQPDTRNEEAFRFRPGQHLTLRTVVDGVDIRRSYSLCVAPDHGAIKVAIKRVADGRFSNWAFSLEVGHRIDAMGPRGHFTWAFDAAKAQRYLAIAGGSGITPILSLMEAALVTEPLSSFTLFYGNHSSSSIMFLEELAGLKNRYLDRLQVFHFLSAEEDDIDLFNGRLDRDRIKDSLDSLADAKRLNALFICGPAGLMDAAEEAARDAGIPEDHILAERFVAARPTTDDKTFIRRLAKKAEGLSMAVTIDGRRRSVLFGSDHDNILDSANAAGLPAPFACKAGVCATCRARLTAGNVTMKANYGLSAQEVAAGYILTCQAILTRRQRGRISASAMSAISSADNGPEGSNQVWVQFIMPNRSMVCARARAELFASSG
jgi:ring-1,2-phenylacetyl-CoA epoxidase subunit PaaE